MTSDVPKTRLMADTGGRRGQNYVSGAPANGWTGIAGIGDQGKGVAAGNLRFNNLCGEG